MILLDSSIWLEYLSGGPLKDMVESYFSNRNEIVTPSIVLYEVYKKLRQGCDEDDVLIAAGQIKDTKVIPLTEKIALTAADFSLEHSLAMADAIIYATAFEHGCKIVTSDAHFEKLDNVVYIKK